jgi:hypothetical protein
MEPMVSEFGSLSSVGETLADTTRRAQGSEDLERAGTALSYRARFMRRWRCLPVLGSRGMMKGQPFAVVSLLLLAACGGDSAGSTETTEPPDYGAQYVALTMRINCVMQRFHEAQDEELAGTPDEATVLNRLGPLADEVAAAHSTFVDDLMNAEWAENVQPAVDAVIDSARRVGPLWAAAADAQSREQWNDAMMAVDEATDPAAAAALREQLGVGPAPQPDGTISCS